MKTTVIDSTYHTHHIFYKRHEYANLMELIIDNYYEEIGDCGSRGLCGTCHVYTNTPLFQTITSIEQSTLDKLEDTTINSRLACQIMVDEHIHGMTFTIIYDH